MRRSPLDCFLGFCMQGDDVPQFSNRVDLDPAVRDVRGLPVARTTYQPHRHEIVASRYHGAKLVEVLRVAGAGELYTVHFSQDRGQPSGLALGDFYGARFTPRRRHGTHGQ